MLQPATVSVFQGQRVLDKLSSSKGKLCLGYTNSFVGWSLHSLEYFCAKTINEDIIAFRCHIHNLSSSELKAWKNLFLNEKTIVAEFLMVFLMRFSYLFLQ